MNVELWWEVCTGYINLGRVSIEMVLEALTLDEISLEVRVARDEQGSKDPKHSIVYRSERWEPAKVTMVELPKMYVGGKLYECNILKAKWRQNFKEAGVNSCDICVWLVNSAEDRKLTIRFSKYEIFQAIIFSNNFLFPISSLIFRL